MTKPIRTSLSLLTTELTCIAVAVSATSPNVSAAAWTAAVGCVVTAGVHLLGVLNR